MSDMTFQPQLVLDSHRGDAAKNYPISLRIYSAESDKTELYRLRYRAFLDAGWIAANAEGEFIDGYDGLPSTFAVGAFHNQECIGSLRLAFGGNGYRAHTMPCEEQFANEIHSLNPSRRCRTVEFSRMALEPSLDNRSFRTTLYASLIRAGVLLSDAADMDIALIAVHRRTSPFYQTMCGFKVAGKSDSYLRISEPTDFLSLRFSEIKKRRSRINSFFAFSEYELESAREVMSKLRN